MLKMGFAFALESNCLGFAFGLSWAFALHCQGCARRPSRPKQAAGVGEACVFGLGYYFKWAGVSLIYRFTDLFVGGTLLRNV